MAKKTFQILVEETLSRTVEVLAEDEDQAVAIVQAKYDAEEIVLDASDLSDTLIREVNTW